MNTTQKAKEWNLQYIGVMFNKNCRENRTLESISWSRSLVAEMDNYKQHQKNQILSVEFNVLKVL